MRTSTISRKYPRLRGAFTRPLTTSELAYFRSGIERAMSREPEYKRTAPLDESFRMPKNGGGQVTSGRDDL